MSDVKKEAELTLVCRIKDFEQLLQAESCEEQEQYLISTPASDADPFKREFRIRRSRIRGQTSYTTTGKVRGKDGAPDEKEAPSDEEHFAVLKLVASSGMFKYRYRFPYPEPINGETVYWEIDVYADEQSGVAHPWCRVELEFPTDAEGNVYVPEKLADLPIQFEEVLSQHDPDPTVKQRITELYGQYFISRTLSART